jgi:hypothetical protein
MNDDTARAIIALTRLGYTVTQQLDGFYLITHPANLIRVISCGADWLPSVVRIVEGLRERAVAA